VAVGSESGSLTIPDGGPAPGGTDEIEVPVVSLDVELAGLVEVKLVKIDVEGSELAVLLAMERLLRERRVHMIDIELIDRHAGANWDGLAHELRGSRLTSVHGSTGSTTWGRWPPSASRKRCAAMA
jgi:hypothetical protein